MRVSTFGQSASKLLLLKFKHGESEDDGSSIECLSPHIYSPQAAKVQAQAAAEVAEGKAFLIRNIRNQSPLVRPDGKS